MYFFCQLCNYSLLTERAEPWKLVADTRVTGSKDLVASSSASGGNRQYQTEWLWRLVGCKTKWGKAVTRQATATWRKAPGQLGR